MQKRINRARRVAANATGRRGAHRADGLEFIIQQGLHLGAQTVQIAAAGLARRLRSDRHVRMEPDAGQPQCAVLAARRGTSRRKHRDAGGRGFGEAAARAGKRPPLTPPLALPLTLFVSSCLRHLRE